MRLQMRISTSVPRQVCFTAPCFCFAPSQNKFNLQPDRPSNRRPATQMRIQGHLYRHPIDQLRIKSCEPLRLSHIDSPVTPERTQKTPSDSLMFVLVPDVHGISHLRNRPLLWEDHPHPALDHGTGVNSELEPGEDYVLALRTRGGLPPPIRTRHSVGPKARKGVSGAGMGATSTFSRSPR